MCCNLWRRRKKKKKKKRRRRRRRRSLVGKVEMRVDNKKSVL